MRRYNYPSGTYIIENESVLMTGVNLRDFMKKQGYKIIKFDQENEGNGTVIISTNIEKATFIPKKSEMVSKFASLFSGEGGIPDKIDFDAQRIGIEMYLWPSTKDLLLEIFILPYMERLNRPEIPKLSERGVEQITDWCICESTWETIIPEIKAQFDARPVIRNM
jgi:hypothetical protein